MQLNPSQRQQEGMKTWAKISMVLMVQKGEVMRQVTRVVVVRVRLAALQGAALLHLQPVVQAVQWWGQAVVVTGLVKEVRRRLQGGTRWKSWKKMKGRWVAKRIKGVSWYQFGSISNLTLGIWAFEWIHVLNETLEATGAQTFRVQVHLPAGNRLWSVHM